MNRFGRILEALRSIRHNIQSASTDNHSQETQEKTQDTRTIRILQDMLMELPPQLKMDNQYTAHRSPQGWDLPTPWSLTQD